MSELTPKEIVEELDKHIVGQRDAKRAIAVAIRNRWRRQRVDESMRDEIGPKNVMMIGPTGVGKTEIARRLASLTGAPFIKVDATKYTEVGYHGSDVESMVRELVENALSMVREEERKENEEKAKKAAEERLIESLVAKYLKEEDPLREYAEPSDELQVEAEPDSGVNFEKASQSGPSASAIPGFNPPNFEETMAAFSKITVDPSSPEWFTEVSKTVESLMKSSNASKPDSAAEGTSGASGTSSPTDAVKQAADSSERSAAIADEQARARKAKRLRPRVERALHQGKLEEDVLEFDRRMRAPKFQVLTPDIHDIMSPDFFDDLLRSKKPRHSEHKTTVAEARTIFYEEELEKLLDEEKIRERAVKLAENLGVIFIDEIDKIVGTDTSHADVSRQGVQRDLLPIVEGTTIRTRYGLFSTSHVLFIAAGAFHRVKPSDLTPELQGRFPIRVELSDLKKADFIRILTEPKNALTRQYVALMKTENIELVFEDDAIEAIASYAEQANLTTQNIGARRLYTIMERLLEDLNFEAASMRMGRVVINAAYVREKIESVVANEDLSKFIL